MNIQIKTIDLKKVLLILILMLQLIGCDEISQGDQRKKFEFLYKMNNYATLFREYSGSISYYSDIDIYKKRMNKLYLNIDEMKPIEGYPASFKLRNNFMYAIDSNMRILGSFDQVNKSDSVKIRDEFEIIKINENVDAFINDLNDEISVVGKE